MNKSLKFYGADVFELIQNYGTPLYIVSEDYIRERCAEIKETFTGKYPDTRAVYASKAFQTLDMCRIINSEGLGFDVVSGGELYAALKAGANPEHIIFHGNSKTVWELEEALDAKVGTIVVDNMSELELLNEVAGRAGVEQKILLRITPGVDSHTHQYISTGQSDSKFGFSVEEALNVAVERALKSEHVDLYGIHFHIGSQLSENDSHVMAVKIILELLGKLKEKYGFTARELNCGGGFGVHYAGDPERLPISAFTDEMMKLIDEFYESIEDKRPTVIIEPGRWIVSEAGITVYEVGAVKTNAAGRTYIGVDGGMSDNPRVALYEAKYEVTAVEKYGEECTEKVTIAGKCCESGDILAWDVMLPPLKRGEHLALLCTGAYNFSMACNYNKLPRPAVVTVTNGNPRLSVRRQTYEDMLIGEI